LARKRLALVCLLVVTVLLGMTACQKKLTGEVIVYHAGSLTIPFEAIEKEFEKVHSGVDVKRQAGGSTALARMITEAGDRVDVFASADYTVIDKLMIPAVASWDAYFANNSMVIMYTPESNGADRINADNWYEVLLEEGVNHGHSDPDLDPCGYRSLLVWQLAEKHYNQEGLYQRLTDSCPEANVRPKSVELIALLETGVLDYAFEYESVALQHAAVNPDFLYVSLPDEINLGNVSHADFYETASVDVAGSEPGQTIAMIGQPIVYGVTMPSTGQNEANAVAFLKFLFDPKLGLKILADQGQPVISPVEVAAKDKLPEALKSLVK